MVSALDPGLSSPGLNPGRNYCVVFLNKTLYSHGTSLRPGVQVSARIVKATWLKSHPFKFSMVLIFVWTFGFSFMSASHNYIKRESTCFFVDLVLFCFISDSSIILSGKYELEEIRRLVGARSAVLNPCLEKIRSPDYLSQVSFLLTVILTHYFT